MKQKIKILFATSELTPLAKVGGLGDVAGALPKELQKLRTDIRIIMPYYWAIHHQHVTITRIHATLSVRFGNQHNVVKIFQTFIPNSSVPIYLLYNYRYLSSGKIYAGGKERFMFFAQAINEFLKFKLFQPDILHINDWHPAAVISLVKKDQINKDHPYKTLLTVHNPAMQGQMKNSRATLWHPSLAQPKQIKYNTLKEAIKQCDLLNTVSVQYAKEILTEKYGKKLCKSFRARKEDLTGIINGVDTNLFNPQNDKFIKTNYSVKTINKKIKNKLFLQEKTKLPINPALPIIGLVSRLTTQKGIKLIIDNIDRFAKLPAQFIFTGVGNKLLVASLKKKIKTYPNKFYFLNAFDTAFGQQVYAGADIFLMPSLFEPCGLGQMIAMKYGTIPIVRATGGLADTVQDGHNGFVFQHFQANELYKKVKYALSVYANKKKWRQLQIRAMHHNFTWKDSAQKYLQLYKKLSKM